MDDKLKEDLKNLNIPDSKIEEIGKKKKFVERLKYVLDQAKVKKGDKELGLLLIQLAEKLNPAYNHRLPLLLKYFFFTTIRCCYCLLKEKRRRRNKQRRI